MAAEVSTMPGVNGNYAPHQGYGSIEAQQHHNNGAYNSNNTTGQPVYPPNSSSTPATNATGQQSDIPKDEVGWYFVEQYYTTLSRNPEKLFLFYNKRSQFVSGQETDKVTVCVGQRAINDKIKELDFHDCKVRVTNVDSQASDSNIVIQVIGEISNKSQPHKKFTQTFVLATQTNGYFVLNDIFRYLVEEEDEPEQDTAELAADAQHTAVAEHEHKEPSTTATEGPSKTLTSSTDPADIEHDASILDRELHSKVTEEPPKIAEETATAVNGGSEGEHAEHETEEAKETEEASIEPASHPEEVSSTEKAPVDDELKPEKPLEPEPTPAASPPKQASAQPAAPSKPAAPKTWATLAAAANRSVATPAAPTAPASSSTPPTASQPRPTPPSVKAAAPVPATPSTAAVATPPAPAAVSAAPRDASPANSQPDEWTAVGGGHNRQQSRQTDAPPPEPQNRGYVKNVHEGVDGSELRSHLEQFGEITYFDIARQKNCAFVDFKTVEGYNAAIAGNPHVIGTERLYVEKRHFRPGSTPYMPRGHFQGGRGRGGVNQGPSRGNFQGGRGGNGFPPRGGRGGASAARGRGGPPAP